jgi:hypothetical protein
MIRKTIYTILWTSVTLFAAMLMCVAVIGLLGPRICAWLGDINEKTPFWVNLSYTILPFVPLLPVGACLLLCVFGKLPGTKRRSAP